MAQVVKEFDAYLHVGTMVLVQIGLGKPVSRRLRSALRGWRHGQFVLLDRPELSPGILYDFEIGHPLVIRFLRDGLACAFDTEAIDWDSRYQSPSLRVKWPASMQCVPFRKSERLRLRIPCTLHTAQGPDMEAEIDDVSSSGCRVRLSRRLEHGAQIRLSFSMPDGAIIDSMEATVRNVTPAGKGFAAGCEFKVGQEALESDLAFFISTTFERQRIDLQPGRSGTRVLLVDSAAESTKRLKDHLEGFGCEVVQAQNAVDALYRLRMSSPAVAIINHELCDLPGLELGRIIHQHRDFERLSLYLYGGRQPGLGEAAKAGGFFAHFEDLDEIAQRIFGQAKPD
ncbi:MAG: PilZ domain-containing protein [Candidatus Hydrogenedentes bacterium]|nr:PilZ domain-containing protein [Candidatus Hydrogenedentota bacterium]